MSSTTSNYDVYYNYKLTIMSTVLLHLYLLIVSAAAHQRLEAVVRSELVWWWFGFVGARTRRN